MKNDGNSSFSGLPVSLVREILAKTGQIAEDIYKPFHEIGINRDKLREQLEQNDLIQSDSGNENNKIASSCGVDGYSKVEKLLTSELSCSAVFGVEGLIPPSGEKHWKSPSHKALLYTEKQYPDTSGILNAIMMEMKVELAANAPHEIIILNGSYISNFVTFMESLRPALETKESKISNEFINRIRTSIVSFKTIFESGDADKIWIGFPQNSFKKEFVNRLNWPDYFDEKILFTILLSPGEFTAPIPVDHSELSNVRKIPIKDEKFSAVRDSLTEAIGKLHVLYYRPHNWTMAFRIEIAEPALKDPSRLGMLLHSVKFQCRTAGITVPYPIYSVEKMAISLKKAIPSLRKSATSHITNLHNNDMGDIFPLIMFNKQDL